MRSQLKNLTAGPHDNIGLLLERYSPSKLETADALKAHLERCAGAQAPQDYRRYFEAWRQSVDALGLWSFEARLLSRMTLGTGEASPIENGIALNRLFGLPIVPGSSLKGALRAAAQEMLGITGNIPPNLSHAAMQKEFSDAGGMLADTFGSASQMAAVSVWDAWWVPGQQKPYVLETWTPHHTRYMSEASSLPVETESPVPISLLAVPRGARFRFAIDLPSPEWREALKPVMERALARGLGAKFNQGYGRFKVEDWNMGG